MSVFLSIPESDWVGKNQFAFAVRDGFPVSAGHTLVITRRVVPTWFDANAEEQSALLDLVSQVKAGLDAELNPDGYNVGFNVGPAAGQTVSHLHVHVIPRYLGDMADPRGGVRHVIPDKGNYLGSPGLELVTPEGGRMRNELVRCLAHPAFGRVDLLASFVMRSGVEVLGEQIDAALERGARIRVLTTDYLAVTDVGALGFFCDRLGDHPSGGRLEVRVFEASQQSFHPKAYLFSDESGQRGVAFVGSSNLSRSALQLGVEWNLVTSRIGHLAAEFDALWEHPNNVDLNLGWLSAYAERRAEIAGARVEHSGELVGDEEPEGVIVPWSVQTEALEALAATRLDGHRAGLVVMATGLGKTWLAAFDSTRPGIKRVLFIAHRAEILVASRDVFRRVRPTGTFTLWVGGVKDVSGDVVFASVQSLEKNLDEFGGDEFDYIVVDEFHHAAAPTYRRVIAHFRPRFMLGLTATPDRTDAADLLALCDDNLVYECGLLAGLRRGLLSPFRYRAIKDVVDYEHIPWTSGRFVIDELTTRLETIQRANQVIGEWEHMGGPDRRTIAFCCSITHADFMADQFRQRGHKAAAVHTGPTSDDRVSALHDLEFGDLQVVFSVDLFNEGIDLPRTDMVLMLRPTESPIVFFQQLGRGLRKTAGKNHLDVIDLVGNHRGFFLKARMLAALAGATHPTDREAVTALKEPIEGLPEGCSIVVETEVVELLEELLGPTTKDSRLADLVRSWIDDHGGRRPTALEFSLAVGKGFTFGKRQGGWFGFLSEHGFLSDEETAVLEASEGILPGIEHGAYTKSFKLITLQALAAVDGLRGRTNRKELALSCRWRIMSDPRLLNDLSDAQGSFADVSDPADSEWIAYWRKNPIAALTGDGGWFSLDGDDIVAADVINAELGSTFDALVAEIVEYRLHRYLVGQEARRPSESLSPVRADGTVLDAAFRIETTFGGQTSVLFESAGGGARRQYPAGIDLVLERLGSIRAMLVDAYVDSTKTRHLPLAERRVLDLESDLPIDLSMADAAATRKRLLRPMKKIGQEPGATGGNSRKALRIVVGGVDQLSNSQLVNLLQHGTAPEQSKTALGATSESLTQPG